MSYHFAKQGRYILTNSDAVTDARTDPSCRLAINKLHPKVSPPNYTPVKRITYLNIFGIY